MRDLLRNLANDPLLGGSGQRRVTREMAEDRQPVNREAPASAPARERRDTGQRQAQPAPGSALGEPGSPAARVRSNLQHRETLRSAILASEILSPPRSLRGWDQH